MKSEKTATTTIHSLRILHVETLPWLVFRNVSTGSLVAMSTRPFHRRLLGVALSDIWKATVSAVVGAGVGLAFTVFRGQSVQGAIPGDPAADDAWPEVLVPIGLLLVVLVLMALRRWRSGRWSPTLVGLAFGLTAGAVLVALAA